MAFTESLLLPSRGLIYRQANFDGYVNVKPFTTRAYKDLAASNASESGLKQFIETCLVDCPVKAKNMSQNDLLAILFKIRAMTLGNKLKTEVTCPECGHVEDIEWDLSTIEISYLFVDEYPIKIELPISKEEIRVRFLTGKDTILAKQAADKRSSIFKKPANEFLHVFNTVSLIDHNSMDIIEKAEWYENLNPADAIYIDEVFREMNNSFGVQLTKETNCRECEHLFTTFIDVGSDFFRPYANIKTGITSKTGNLAGIVEKSNISE